MATDPICGMTVDPNSAAGSYEHNGQTYYFCSQHCVAKFKENPATYVKVHQASGGERSSKQSASVIDPVCGMSVDPARAAGKQKHGDETYYFCSRRCMVKFIADPDAILKEPRQASQRSCGLYRGPATLPPAR